MQKNWRDFVVFVRFVASRFFQDRCPDIAASLTFTTLLSLVPLITIALTIFSAFPVFDNFSNEIKTFLLDNLMPDKAGKVITQYMQQFSESATRLTAVGIAFLGVTAMLVMVTIEQAFDNIWKVSRPRRLLKRLTIYWAVLTLAPLLMGASLSLTSWLLGLSLGYVKSMPIFGVGVLKILPVLLTTLAFATLFRIMPNRYVPIRHALTGAFAAAMIFETMNRIFGYYISNFSTYRLVYGAFSSVPIFLMWVYIFWLTILLGAVIAASLSHWRTPEPRHLPAVVKMLDALRVLKIMSENLRRGEVISFPALSRILCLGFDALDEIMGRLENAGMVRKAQGHGWLAVRDPACIRAAELLHLFVLDRSDLLAQQDDPLSGWLAACAEQLERSTDITLQELFEQQPD